MRRRRHDPSSGEEIQREIVTSLFAAAQVAEPRAEGVDPRRHDIVPQTDAIGDKRRPPAIIALALHGSHVPLARFAVPNVQAADEFLVAVAEDIGFDYDEVTADTFHSETARVYLGAHPVDHHPALEVVWQVHGSIRHETSPGSFQGVRHWAAVSSQCCGKKSGCRNRQPCGRRQEV